MQVHKQPQRGAKPLPQQATSAADRASEAEVSAPLVPADVDLRGLPWMRLDTIRLLDSDLYALSNGAEFKAAVSLWCKSWSQVPAGSLPLDDRILGHLSGSSRFWKRVKNMSLRGWIECSDGRLYHPVVAEQVLAAWDERQEFRAEVNARNERKRKERKERADMFEHLKAAGHNMAWNTPTAVLRGKCKEFALDLSRDLSRDITAPDSVTVTAKTGRDGTGVLKALNTTTEESMELTVAREADSARGDEPGQLGEVTNQCALATRAIRKHGIQGNPSHPILLAGVQEGVPVECYSDAAADAARAGKGFAWVLATARGRWQDSQRAPPTAARRETAADRLQRINGNHDGESCSPGRVIDGEVIARAG